MGEKPKSHISTDAENTFGKIQPLVMILKITRKLELARTLQLNKLHALKICSSILYGKETTRSLYDREQGKRLSRCFDLTLGWRLLPGQWGSGKK
jgi:hypothetical protein